MLTTVLDMYVSGGPLPHSQQGFPKCCLASALTSRHNIQILVRQESVRSTVNPKLEPKTTSQSVAIPSSDRHLIGSIATR